MPGPGSPASSVDDGPPSPSHAELVKRGSMRSRSKSVVVMEMRMPKPLGKERTLFRLPQVMVAVSGSITPRDLGERAENWFEMFYDLVFVAVCLIMGNYLGESITLTSCFDSFVMIIVFTATWYAVTAYINRFFSEDLKHQAFYFLQTFCVIVCAKSSNPDLSQAARFSIMLAISRAGLVLMYIYIGVVYHEELTQLRSMYVKQYVFAVAMYIAAALAFSSDTVGGVSGDTVGVVLWVVQVICDWQAAMWLGPPGYACVRHTPIPLFDVEHMSKRLAEYTMLILGESVISLCFANDEKASEELKIFGLFLAVSIVFFMRLLYFDQIPHDRNKHAFKYSVVCGRLFNFSHWPLAGGLLLAGVGFKKVLSKISYEYVPTPYANLLSISLALSLTTINFISNTHTGFFGCMATDDFLGESTATPRMKAPLALRIVLILITGTQSLWASSFSPWMYITCHSVVVFILWCIDLYEDLHLHNAGHRVQNEMEGGAGAFFPEADDDVEGGAAGGDSSGPEKGAGNGAALDVEEVHSPQLSPRLEPLSNGDKEGKGEHAVADKPLP